MSLYDIDLETLARALPTCMGNRHTAFAFMHFDRMYSFGSIHEKRCLPTARTILSRLRKHQVARSSGDSPGASGGRSGETPASRAMPDNRDRRTPRCERCRLF